MLKDETWRNSAWAQRAEELKEERKVIPVHHRLYQVIDYIRQMEIKEFSSLVNAIQDGGANPLFWDVVVEHTEFINAYLQSAQRRHVAMSYQAMHDVDCLDDEEDEEEKEDGDMPW